MKGNMKEQRNLMNWYKKKENRFITKSSQNNGKEATRKKRQQNKD